MPNVKGIVANGGPNDVVDGQKIGLSDEIKNCGLPVFTFDYEDNGTVHPMPKEDEAIQEDLRSLYLIPARRRLTGIWKTLLRTKLNSFANK